MIFRLITCVILLQYCSELSAQSVRIESIEIVGNQHTKEKVILRELMYQVGDTLNSEKVSEYLQLAENRLMNLNLFNSVNVLSSSEGSLLTLRIELVEKWYIWPIPFIEFSDRNFNTWQDLSFDKSRTNYGLYLFNYNLFGLNHTAKLSIVDGYHQKLGFEYRIPFIGKRNMGFHLKYAYSSQNEVWRNTLDDRLQFFKNGELDLMRENEWELGFSQRFGKFVDHELRLGLLDTKIAVAAFREVPNELYFQEDSTQQTMHFVSYEVTQDLQDNHYLPMKGTYKSLGVSWEQYNGVQNFKLNGEFRYLPELSERMSGAISAYGEYNSNEHLAYYNNRMLGYDHYVRGFEPYVIEGNWGFHLQTAIRYHAIHAPAISIPWFPVENYQLLPFNMYLEYFVESGFVSNTQFRPHNKLPNQQIWSTGISLQNLFYNDRVIRFEYSLNSLKETGFFVHFLKAI